ncbi:hypothetical protein BDW74DRAFT_152159 [Aspergillus multicolor]|uniref:uncharacterized protein n=1 Tax=Aspergillus multicolor TaxID=41759 RepID=UPI003CCD9568
MEFRSSYSGSAVFGVFQCCHCSPTFGLSACYPMSRYRTLETILLRTNHGLFKADQLRKMYT